MESVKVDENCKKNLIAPYQQSFRIDDLLTRKVIDQQPGLLPHHNHHHYHHHHSSITALQSPPVGMISSHHHHHPHHNLEKPPPPIDISATSGGGSSGSQRAGYANGKVCILQVNWFMSPLCTTEPQDIFMSSLEKTHKATAMCFSSLGCMFVYVCAAPCGVL